MSMIDGPSKSANCAACHLACRASTWSASLHAARAAPRSVCVPAPAGFLRWLATSGASIDGAPGGAAFTAALDAAVARVGGTAFCKLGPVAPADAGWAVLGGEPRATNAAEVLALLRSSERVGAALDSWISSDSGGCEEPPWALEVVVRPWMALHPARELRAFVRCGVAVAVCARQPDAVESAAAAAAVDGGEDLRAAAADFLADVIPRLPLTTCVVDFYIDSRGRGWLLDIAPLASGRVDTLAFAPDEVGLCGSDSDACQSCADLAAETKASLLPSPPSPMLWRLVAAPEIDAAAPTAVGPAPPPPDAATTAAALLAAASRAPALSANRFPDELLLLAAATGRSVAALLEDMEGAVRAAGLAGDVAEPLLQGGSDDDDSEEDGIAREAATDEAAARCQ